MKRLYRCPVCLDSASIGTILKHKYDYIYPLELLRVHLKNMHTMDELTKNIMEDAEDPDNNYYKDFPENESEGKPCGCIPGQPCEEHEDYSWLGPHNHAFRWDTHCVRDLNK